MKINKKKIGMAGFMRKKCTLMLYFIIIALLMLALVKNEYFSTNNATFTLLSAANFKQLQYMTFGAVKRKIVTAVEVVQFDIMSKVRENSNETECLYLKNANPPYHACYHTFEHTTPRVKKNLYWESGTQNLIKQFFESYPNSTFVDLGSNVGYHSVYAANLNTNIRVLAVEPFPKNVLVMHRAAHMNNVQSRIELIMAAVSDKRGPVTFYQTNNSMSQSSLKETSNKAWYKGFTTSSIILDDLIPLIKTKTIFLKVDVEGYECYIFSRAAKFFDEFDIPLVFTEIRHTKSQPCFEPMVKFFKDRNYLAYPDHHEEKDLDYKTFNNWMSHDMHFKKKLI